MDTIDESNCPNLNLNIEVRALQKNLSGRGWGWGLVEWSWGLRIGDKSWWMERACVSSLFCNWRGTVSVFVSVCTFGERFSFNIISLFGFEQGGEHGCIPSKVDGDEDQKRNRSGVVVSKCYLCIEAASFLMSVIPVMLKCVECQSVFVRYGWIGLGSGGGDWGVSFVRAKSGITMSKGPARGTSLHHHYHHHHHHHYHHHHQTTVINHQSSVITDPSWIINPQSSIINHR